MAPVRGGSFWTRIRAVSRSAELQRNLCSSARGITYLSSGASSNTGQISVLRSSCPLLCTPVLSSLQMCSGGSYSPDSPVCCFHGGPRGGGVCYLPFAAPLTAAGRTAQSSGRCLVLPPMHITLPSTAVRCCTTPCIIEPCFCQTKGTHWAPSWLVKEGASPSMGRTLGIRNTPVMGKGCQTCSLPPSCKQQAEPLSGLHPSSVSLSRC